MRIIITILVLGFLVGCTTTKMDLMSRPDSMESWTASAPITEVFKTYKGYAEQHYNGTVGLLGDSYLASGYFYGPDAELTIRLVGNPFSNTTFLHFEMQQQEKATAVKAWHYNGPWKNNAAKFRELLSTE